MYAVGVSLERRRNSRTMRIVLGKNVVPAEAGLMAIKVEEREANFPRVPL